ncbi:MAG: ABC alpha-glucoside transporter, inner membrane subunit AglF [Candidatus Bipolaricaulis sibiricus]|uniref:ABC alpha-glucoside transporter, inner membrane subunit AglF n=1 Tax=Bipolaricaulis sibiricus TaxID=2501609 RepID=A0A410FSQ1_BIPS1|nr:MAG: ABC alpha-glucoside transporter, inner membrane subunit AglF [Candidatus Bipolaricaulis sibiricus]
MNMGRAHWLYLAPALLLLGVFLVYPSAETIRLSFYGPRSDTFVGVQNYVRAFTSRPMLIAFRNNLLWLGVFTLFTVGMGLVLAVLLDRVRYEAVIKSVIFLPMAISYVAAGVIWRFVYAFRPAVAPQIGLLNAIVVGLGGQPVGWLIQRPWVNNIALIVVGVWVWTGFCMVIISAAYKGIPREMQEAARIDGANEWQVFRHVTIPFLKSTLAVVTTTMIVFVLKVFDIVYMMTNGAYDTDVIANRMYNEMFQFSNYGMASAIAVILFLAIVPFLVLNVRRFRVQEAVR